MGHVDPRAEEVEIVYATDSYSCTADDFVILYAHGGKEETYLSNNQGQTMAMREALNLLEGIDAQVAQRVLFMCCFSASGGHVAERWKKKHAHQSTFGNTEAISNLFSATRSGLIRGVCVALQEL